MSKGVFSRLYDKTSYTGMYAERFAPGDPSNEEIEPAHAFELRPSMNMRIQARERLATSPRGVDRPKLEKNATVRTLVGGGRVVLVRNFPGGVHCLLFVSHSRSKNGCNFYFRHTRFKGMATMRFSTNCVFGSTVDVLEKFAD